MTEKRDEGSAFYQRIVDAFSRDLDFSATLSRVQGVLDIVLERSLRQLRPYAIVFFVILLLNTALQACLCWALLYRPTMIASV